jgi:hypothetical protein
MGRMSDRPGSSGEPPAGEPKASGSRDRPEADPVADSGLFGKLPRSRPGTRSPRRGAAGGDEVRSEPVAEAKPTPAPEAKPTPAPAPPAGRAESAPRARPAARERAAPAPSEEPGAGLEDLAWAGIAVTAEAATLGVRLVSRAIDAARKAAERR